MVQNLRSAALFAFISIVSSVASTNLAIADTAVEEKPEGNTLNFLGGASMGYKNISFVIPAGGVSFEPHLMMFNMSGTLSYGNIFTTVNYDQTIKDDLQYLSSTNETNVLIMSRDDRDISIGYYLGKGFSTFVGYKDGTLTANLSGTRDTVGGGCAVPPCAITPFTVEFHDAGPFVGMSYTAALENSSLIFNLAYADMKGDITFGTKGTTSGDTTGLSYSVAWNVPISDSTTFTTKVNLIRYDFNDTELGIPSGGGGVDDFTFQQKFDVISFTLAHYF